MKFIGIFENFINRIIGKLVTKLSKSVSAKIPEKLKTSLNSTPRIKEKLKSAISQKGVGVKNFSLDKKTKMLVKIDQGVTKAHQLKGGLKEHGVKGFVLEAFRGLKSGILPVFEKGLHSLSKVGPKAFTLGLTICLLVCLTALQFISSGKKVYREVASKTPVEKLVLKDARGPHYKKSYKFLRMPNVTIPVDLDSIGPGQVKSLLVDFTLICSNRYIREYFYANDYLVRDRMNSTVETIIPSFPLEMEGKQVLRDKILEELNKLILELNIEGEFEDLRFHSIMAG